jgi:hypothetical protein
MVSTAFLVGCESTPDVRADYDHGTNFSQYKTFNFVSNPATDRAGYSTLTTQQIESAVTTQMQMRGYTLSDHPDLLVNFSGKLQAKQEVRSSPSAGPYYGGYYGYRRGFYGAWPGYANDVYTVNYTEGTLNIDLVDAFKKQMVWEGVSIARLSKEHLENRQTTINTAVADIFSRYPFRAGQSQPVTPPAN